MLKILSLIIFFFFINTVSCFANEEIYNIKNNEVYLENTGNVLELRENAKKISFKNGFNILAKNILTPEDFIRFSQISEFNPTELVSDYKIESEKITEINYNAEISINFNPKRVKKFFSDNNIDLNIFVSESYLIFPVFKKFNTLYLWDKENLWYDFLLEEYDQQSLLKLYFPKKSNINRLKISAEQIINMNLTKITNFLDLYNKKKAIIVFFEQKFDINKNNFVIKLDAKLFSNNTFKQIEIGENDLLISGKNLSETDLVAKFVINELQNWWKSRIDSEKLASNSESLILLSIDSEDIKKSFFIEEALFEIIGTKNAKIKELRGKETIYEIFTNYSVMNINLRLESKNLRLIKAENDNNLYKVESY
ncbi:MAG: hypothetical protein CMP38_02040 [Rickettsiales bacterium]|nr:hypothetical protein [Rickettsiales bacterium]|tara:strand:+ start:296 stop:1396 length:1101 start_codon:yes stop_codon:yes gene_type:complete